MQTTHKDMKTREKIREQLKDIIEYPSPQNMDVTEDYLLRMINNISRNMIVIGMIMGYIIGMIIGIFIG